MFHISIEIAVCTEKFARLNNWFVPIVLKDDIYRDIVPKNGYIAVDIFESMKELREYRTSLFITTSDRIEGIFPVGDKCTNIIDTYSDDHHFGRTDAYCNLCEKLRTLNPTISTIKSDIVSWYDGPGVCRRYSLTLYSRLRHFLVFVYQDVTKLEYWDVWRYIWSLF